MSSKSVGVFQRCQTSNWIPSAGGSPASWISSTASGIEEAIVHCSPPSRWYGSSATAHAVTLGLGGDRPQAVDDGRRAPRPGRAPRRCRSGSTSPLGRNGASRAIEWQIRLDPLGRILGAAEERQRQDRGDGGDRGRPDSRPLASKSSSSLEILALGQFQLPDADPVQAGLGVVDAGRPRSSTSAS